MIQTETFHSDYGNPPKIQASLLTGYVGKNSLTQCLKTSKVNSWLRMSTNLTQTKIIMLIYKTWSTTVVNQKQRLNSGQIDIISMECFGSHCRRFSLGTQVAVFAGYRSCKLNQIENKELAIISSFYLLTGASELITCYYFSSL